MLMPVLLLGFWAGPLLAPPQAPPDVDTPLPPGFKFSRGADGQLQRLRYDFDQDGRPDVFAVIEKGGDEEPWLAAWLSSRPAGQQFVSHGATDALTCCASLTRRGNVVTAASRGMRYFERYELRYNAQLRDFELIGFDTENFGPATNDGSGTTSYNLLTGQYVAALHTYRPATRRLTADPVLRQTRRPPQRYTLTSFDRALDFLQKQSPR